jgi:hypothetical protein
MLEQMDESVCRGIAGSKQQATYGIARLGFPAARSLSSQYAMLMRHEALFANFVEFWLWHWV